METGFSHNRSSFIVTPKTSKLVDGGWARRGPKPFDMLHTYPFLRQPITLARTRREDNVSISVGLDYNSPNAQSHFHMRITGSLYLEGTMAKVSTGGGTTT